MSCLKQDPNIFLTDFSIIQFAARQATERQIPNKNHQCDRL